MCTLGEGRGNSLSDIFLTLVESPTFVSVCRSFCTKHYVHDDSYWTRISLKRPATRRIVLSGPLRMCDLTAAADASSVDDEMLGQSSVGELKE